MKRKVVWLLSRKQDMINSASELGHEALRGADVQIIRFGRNPFPAARRAWQAHKTLDAVVYFQFGAPAENLAVARLISRGVPVIAHYLDQIADGYPGWARTIGLQSPIHNILRRARLVLAISPAMKRDIAERLGREGPIGVKFRTNPDAAGLAEDVPVEYPRGVIYAGNINRKANFSALVEAVTRLRALDLELAVHTRTTDPAVLEALRKAGVDLRAPIPADQIVRESARYAAQLLPFNTDAASQAFFRTSLPSKLPNVLSARRRVLYFGPREFWLRSWLADQGDLAVDLSEASPGGSLNLTPVPQEQAEASLAALRALSEEIRWDEL